MRPMLATRGTHVPTGEEWQHEVKWDGMRVLVDMRGGRPAPRRNENDVTVSFPELPALPVGDALLDGEVVAFADGMPSFAALAERMHVSAPPRRARSPSASPVTLLVFDVLRLGDRDLSAEPLAVRRELLGDLDLNTTAGRPRRRTTTARCSSTRPCSRGSRGSSASGSTRRYESGPQQGLAEVRAPPPRLLRRGRLAPRDRLADPARCGARRRADPGRPPLPRPGRQRHRRQGRPDAREALAPHARDSSPFVDEVPKLDALGTHWVEPVLVVDVESLGLSAQGRLRQPSYRGVRTDLGPEDLT